MFTLRKKKASFVISSNPFCSELPLVSFISVHCISVFGLVQFSLCWDLHSSRSKSTTKASKWTWCQGKYVCECRRKLPLEYRWRLNERSIRSSCSVRLNIPCRDHIPTTDPCCKLRCVTSLQSTDGTRVRCSKCSYNRTAVPCRVWPFCHQASAWLPCVRLWKALL